MLWCKEPLPTNSDRESFKTGKGQSTRDGYALKRRLDHGIDLTYCEYRGGHYILGGGTIGLDWRTCDIAIICMDEF